MEEITKNIKETKLEVSEKRVWEAPRLISLDKGKTEGGSAIIDHEDYSYDMRS